MLKKILFIITILFAGYNLYAEDMYISWIDNLRIREEPSQSGKVTGSLKKGDIVTSDTVEGETQKVVLNKTDYYGKWSRIKTADSKEGWVFSGALKNYYTVRDYSIYLDGNTITFIKDKKQVKKIPVNKSTIDIACLESGRYIILKPFEYQIEEGEGVFDKFTQVIIVDTASLKVIKTIDGHYPSSSVSPDNETVFLQDDLIGICSPPLTMNGLIYSMKKNKELLPGDYGLDGKWLNNDQFETIINAGREVKGMPDPGENSVYTEIVILDVKSEKIIHTGKYSKIADN